MFVNSKASPPKAALRILIADRSAMISEGLSARLAEQSHILVVGCANKAITALALIESVHPDVVLLDLQVAGDSLVSVLQLMKRHDPSPLVIVLTLSESTVLRERCLQAGGDYVFSKTTELEALNETIEKLAFDKNGIAKK